jgi:hypothetical protein
MKIKIFILIIIIISLLFLTNYLLKNKENFKNNKPNNLIINNCKKNFGKDIKHKNKNHLCNRSAFVTNPILLSGICGSTTKDTNKPVYILKNKKNNKVYYGCNNTVNRNINWNYNNN